MIFFVSPPLCFFITIIIAHCHAGSLNASVDCGNVAGIASMHFVSTMQKRDMITVSRSKKTARLPRVKNRNVTSGDLSVTENQATEFFQSPSSNGMVGHLLFESEQQLHYSSFDPDLKNDSADIQDRLGVAVKPHGYIPIYNYLDVLDCEDESQDNLAEFSCVKEESVKEDSLAVMCESPQALGVREQHIDLQKLPTDESSLEADAVIKDIKKQIIKPCATDLIRAIVAYCQGFDRYIERVLPDNNFLDFYKQLVVEREKMHPLFLLDECRGAFCPLTRSVFIHTTAYDRSMPYENDVCSVRDRHASLVAESISQILQQAVVDTHGSKHIAYLSFGTGSGFQDLVGISRGLSSYEDVCHQENSLISPIKLYLDCIDPYYACYLASSQVDNVSFGEKDLTFTEHVKYHDRTQVNHCVKKAAQVHYQYEQTLSFLHKAFPWLSVERRLHPWIEDYQAANRPIPALLVGIDLDDNYGGTSLETMFENFYRELLKKNNALKLCFLSRAGGSSFTKKSYCTRRFMVG